MSVCRAVAAEVQETWGEGTFSRVVLVINLVAFAWGGVALLLIILEHIFGVTL